MDLSVISGPALGQVSAALQQLSRDPDLRERELEERYTVWSSPSSSSHEQSTAASQHAPISPSKPGQASDIGAVSTMAMAPPPWTPHEVFAKQAKREQSRLEFQRIHEHRGRRLTLPYNGTMELQPHAENNVRQRWIAQGIWGSNWGPAWKSGAYNRADYTLSGIELSDVFPLHNDFAASFWGHETALGDGVSFGNPEASRPHNQFLELVAHEVKWLDDQINYFHEIGGTFVDEVGQRYDIPEGSLDTLARQRVRQHWKEDGIWQDEWDKEGIPGIDWTRAGPEQQPTYGQENVQFESDEEAYHPAQNESPEINMEMDSRFENVDYGGDTTGADQTMDQDVDQAADEDYDHTVDEDLDWTVDDQAIGDNVEFSDDEGNGEITGVDTAKATTALVVECHCVKSVEAKTSSAKPGRLPGAQTVPNTAVKRGRPARVAADAPTPTNAEKEARQTKIVSTTPKAAASKKPQQIKATKATTAIPDKKAATKAATTSTTPKTAAPGTGRRGRPPRSAPSVLKMTKATPCQESQGKDKDTRPPKSQEPSANTTKPAKKAAAPSSTAANLEKKPAATVQNTPAKRGRPAAATSATTIQNTPAKRGRPATATSAAKATTTTGAASASAPTSARRGRPPKSPNMLAETNANSESKPSEQTTTPTPRKRGRPPKAASVEEPTPKACAGTKAAPEPAAIPASAPKKRGRPLTAEQTTVAEQPKRGRGRQPAAPKKTELAEDEPPSKKRKIDKEDNKPVAPKRGRPAAAAKSAPEPKAEQINTTTAKPSAGRKGRPAKTAGPAPEPVLTAGTKRGRATQDEEPEAVAEKQPPATKRGRPSMLGTKKDDAPAAGRGRGRPPAAAKVSANPEPEPTPVATTGRRGRPAKEAVRGPASKSGLSSPPTTARRGRPAKSGAKIPKPGSTSLGRAAPIKTAASLRQGAAAAAAMRAINSPGADDKKAGRGWPKKA